MKERLKEFKYVFVIVAFSLLALGYIVHLEQKLMTYENRFYRLEHFENFCKGAIQHGYSHQEIYQYADKISGTLFDMGLFSDFEPICKSGLD